MKTKWMQPEGRLASAGLNERQPRTRTRTRTSSLALSTLWPRTGLASMGGAVSFRVLSELSPLRLLGAGRSQARLAAESAPPATLY